MNRQIDLVIFHYHLLPGGVTDVIRLSLKAFSRDPLYRSITIASGRKENTRAMEEAISAVRQEDSCRVDRISLQVFPELDYLAPEETGYGAEETKRLLEENFGGEDAVWLVHNYHLGKNWQFTRALLALAEERKQKIVFQIHDFPECGRFANLKILKDHIPGSLYSLSDTVRYCVINERDRDLMAKAGIPKKQLFLLENPLAEGNKDEIIMPQEKEALINRLAAYAPANGKFHKKGELWLYPVRSIRRKNVLEGGIILRLLKIPANLIVTLPGVSATEKAYSDTVEQAFFEGLIPGFWGTGLLPEDSGVTYKNLIRLSDRIFSPSVQEGFGYMYLNAIAWHKPLIARYLDIMGGFLPLFESYPAHFYKEVLIPGKKKLKTALREEYLRRFASLPREIPAEIRDQLILELDKQLSQEGIDVSYLSVLDQYSVLQTLIEDKGYLKATRELNRELTSRLEGMGRPEGETHRKNLYTQYGFEAYDRAFRSIMDSFSKEKTKESSPEGKEPGVVLLREFSRMAYLRLLYN